MNFLNIAANPKENGRGDRFFYDGEGQLTQVYYECADPTTDISGNMMEEYDYDAWGKPHFYSGTSWWSWDLGYSEFGNRFLFTGREWLSDLGVYDYRNRLLTRFAKSPHCRRRKMNRRRLQPIVTLRWAMLLSNGTRRQLGIVSP